MDNKLQNNIVQGVLKRKGYQILIEGFSGEEFFGDNRIWEGYLKHWNGRKVLARNLSQIDRKTNLPIVLVWPFGDMVRRDGSDDYLEIYYNERLVKYWASFLGHAAVNVGGSVFNFSHIISENEILTSEEYFYRPALGEFIPSLDKINTSGSNTVKFGRRFMRSIHVLRVEGAWLGAEKARSIFKRKIDEIRNAPENPNHPGYYADFSLRSNSCATIIRDGLKECYSVDINSFCPRDFFVSCAACFKKLSKKYNLSISYRFIPQLMVSEVPPSKLTPLLNPLNYYRKYRYLDNLPVENYEV